MAARWVEFFSEELAGTPASFLLLQRSVEAHRRTDITSSLDLPTFDEFLDVLRACSRGKAMGPDAAL